MPFAFDQIENEDHEDEQQIEALEECERLDINEMFGGDDEQQEEIDDYSSNSAMGNVEHVTIDDYSPETIVCDRDEYGLRENKRKIIDHSSQNGSSKPVKLIKIDLNKSKPKNGTEATNTKTQYTKGNDLKLERLLFENLLLNHSRFFKILLRKQFSKMF